jgi:hypothetical protein
MKVKSLLVISLALSVCFADAQSKTSPLSSTSGSKNRVDNYSKNSNRTSTGRSSKTSRLNQNERSSRPDHVGYQGADRPTPSPYDKPSNYKSPENQPAQIETPKLDQGFVNLPFNFDRCNTLRGMNGAYLFQSVYLPRTVLIWDFVARWRNCDRDYAMSAMVPASFDIINESSDTLYVLYNSSDRSFFTDFDRQLLGNPMASNMQLIEPLKSVSIRMIGQSFGASIYRKRVDGTFELENQRVSRPQQGSVVLRIG